MRSTIVGPRTRARLYTIGRYILLTTVALILITPLVWMVVSSLRPAGTIFQYTTNISLRTFIPESLTLENYRHALRSDLTRAIGNTVFIGVVSVLVGVVVNSMAGFAFAVFQFRFKSALFIFVLLTFMVPFESIVLPLYQLIRALGWANSYQALIVPGIANGLVVFLFRQFFAGLPFEIYDAARADGANWFQVYWRIAMPLAWPAVVAGSLMLFIFQWDSFFWPLVAASAPKYTVVQVAIARNITYEQTVWGQLFSSMTLAIVVPLVLFLLVQKRYVQSITYVGVK